MQSQNPLSSSSLKKSSPKEFLWIALSALGVVFGDIGTSPLYAMKECFSGRYLVEPSPSNILGIVSLIIWSLIIIVSLKYVTFVLRADNRGEGGILALMVLTVTRKIKLQPLLHGVIVSVGLFGAALLYGDGIITPAISVLSSIEGLEKATPFFKPYVVPLTVLVLFFLFWFQKRGTSGVGKTFGPVLILWFLTLGVLGMVSIVRNPEILKSFYPGYAISFFLQNGFHGFFILGAVFLSMTGCETLYADIGHFGVSPIRISWFSLVLPALLLNYIGQGALLLGDPTQITHPFFGLAPSWALYPMIVLATTATVIASQAVISGIFSLTRQAVQLGYLPRFQIIHTSTQEIGQIYIPTINRLLMLATMFLVLVFKSSSGLASAYGIAVSTTMLITTFLFSLMVWNRWKWPLSLALFFGILFLCIDGSYFLANIIKIREGGWFPLLVAGGVFTLMTTWKEGRRILASRLLEKAITFETFVKQFQPDSLTRVPGTAIFMTGSVARMPHALIDNVRCNRVLHEQSIMVTVVTEEIPRVSWEERLEIVRLGKGFFRVVIHSGYMDHTDIPFLLEKAVQEKELEIDFSSVRYFLGRETLLAEKRKGMALWREKLFAFMARNSERATTYFNIPTDRVMEIGTQIQL